MKRCPICMKKLRFWQTKAWVTFGAKPAVHQVIEGQYWIHAQFVKCHNKCAIEMRDAGHGEIAEQIRENYRNYDYDTYTFTRSPKEDNSDCWDSSEELL